MYAAKSTNFQLNCFAVDTYLSTEKRFHKVFLLMPTALPRDRMSVTLRTGKTPVAKICIRC